MPASPGFPATTLRFYEREGLIAADRTPAGHRVFGDDDAERVGFVTSAKRLGLTLGRIRDLLRVRDRAVCHEVRAGLLASVSERMEDAGQAADLTDLVVAEHGCCPFLTFHLALTASHVELRASALEGAEPLVAALLGEPA